MADDVLTQGLLHELRQALGETLGEWPAQPELEPLAGASLHTVNRLLGYSRPWFVKSGAASELPMFEAEADGLNALRRCRALRVPAVCGHAERAGHAFLVLEWLPLGAPDASGWRRMGEALARLHGDTGERFGWGRNNYLGVTPQLNAESTDWPGFWREQRLLPQLRLAYERGYRGTAQRRADRLLADVEVFFVEHHPAPALLHGDLWHGNVASLDDGQPVFFDPATYRGDREADLAMTELFGGFGADFYAAYREQAPLDVGYPVRRTLYNLYHLLNHLNIFGGDYDRQVDRAVDSLLAEIR